MATLFKYALLLNFFIIISSNTTAQNNNTPKNLGIVLCGAEFGETQLPGTYNKDYTYPTYQEVKYFASKGFSTITLPFKWERVQRKVGGSLDSIELLRMIQFIALCDSAKIKVILTLQNFAVYNTSNEVCTLGSRNLKNDDYKDFWKKMAAALNSCPNIYGFDIMNEPRGVFGNTWKKAAQAAIDGIREVNTNTYIIVDGENSSFSMDWAYDNNKLRKLNDPSDKLIYDAHCYFDFNHSGRYNNYQDDNMTVDIGVKRVMPFVKWLKKHHKKGMIGEFGVPSDSKWLQSLDNFLSFVKENNLQANYWAAGPWWNNYPLSVEPENGKDKPQMKVLEKYLKE